MEVTSNHFLGIKSVCIEYSNENDITFSMQDDNGFFIESWSGVAEDEDPSKLHAFGSLNRDDILDLLATIIMEFDLLEDIDKTLMGIIEEEDKNV